MIQFALRGLPAAVIAIAWAASILEAQGDLAIEHVTVIPMDRDTSLADHTVLISGDRITWIGASSRARVPAGARRVEGRGAYLIPGLADMHVHIENVDDLPAYVAAGVTTIRNLRGGPHYLEWREQVAAGTRLGPRIFTSGPTLVGRPRRGNDQFVPVRSLEEADRVVREQVRAGYDLIKVHSLITVPVYQRILSRARAARIPVVGHVMEDVGPARALAAGQVSLEHADRSLFDGRETGMDEGSRAIAQAGAWVGTVISDRSGRCGPPSDLQRRIIGALKRANVKLLAGSDASLSPLRAGEALHCELSTLVAAGLTPFEALVAATREAGAFARMHLKDTVTFGTVSVGARADLVLLASDPRADISVLSRPVGTVLRGSWRPR